MVLVSPNVIDSDCIIFQWDFTMCSGGLLVLLIILMCFGLLCAFIQNEVIATNIYAKNVSDITKVYGGIWMVHFAI